MAKVRIVTVEPRNVGDVRPGARVKVGYHEQTAQVVSVRRATANKQPCFVLDLRYGDQPFEVYVGVEHTLWLVVDEKIVDEG